MGVKAIESLDEFKKVISSGKVVIVDFWATWCGPCRVISPIFEQMSGTPEAAGVEFYKVDIDAHEDISGECGIRSLPTFTAFKDGNKLGEVLGANPNGLQNLIKQAAST